MRLSALCYLPSVNQINELLPGYSLEIFGSERTRLFLPESDVDMVIIPPNKEELPVQRVRQNLFRLADVRPCQSLPLHTKCNGAWA